MVQRPAIAADSTPSTAEQIADHLAVQMWAQLLVADHLERFAQYPSLLGRGAVAQLESLLVCVRSVADARDELIRLDGALLLDGFAVWGTRQRAVKTWPASSSLGRE